MRKPLLVGQAPGRVNGRARALEGPCAARLARALGIEPPALFEAFDTVNLLKCYPGQHAPHRPRREKGDRFPAAPARRAAARLLRRERDRRVFVLLGARVAAAFGFERKSVVRTHWRHGDVFITIPHPSGCNQWWNAERNRARGGRALRHAIEWVEVLRDVARARS